MSLRRYDTPENVAKALLAYAPRSISNLLDPAAGGGNLIRPLLNSSNRIKSATLIDLDREALPELYKMTSDDKRFRILNRDFIEWGETLIGKNCNEDRKFDCIVMNPPFAAKREDLVRAQDICPSIEGFVPLECAFLLRAIRMLRRAGYMLAIVPSSVVVSKLGEAVRKHLVQNGRIVCVHELPQGTFKGVEARVFMLIFQKDIRSKTILLKNHSLDQPESLNISSCEVTNDFRWDFSFHDSLIARNKLAEQGSWNSISEYAEVFRGDAKSPYGKRKSLHTTDFVDGFWKGHKRHQLRVHGLVLKPADILVARVGRNCADTFGFGVNVDGIGCTDCVLVLRTSNPSLADALLFSIMALKKLDLLRSSLTKGTSSQFISSKELADLKVPIYLARKFKNQFRSFRNAVKRRNSRKMERLVSSVCEFEWNSSL